MEYKQILDFKPVDDKGKQSVSKQKQKEAWIKEYWDAEVFGVEPDTIESKEEWGQRMLDMMGNKTIGQD